MPPATYVASTPALTRSNTARSVKPAAAVVPLNRHDRDSQRPAWRTLIAGPVNQRRRVRILAVEQRTGVADGHRAAAGADNRAHHRTVPHRLRVAPAGTPEIVNWGFRTLVVLSPSTPVSEAA